MDKNFYLETEELLKTIRDFKEVHTISHEGMGSFISTVKDFFVKRLAKLNEIFVINFRRSPSAEELTYYVQEIIKLQPTIAKVSQKLDYLEVVDTVVPTVQGMKTNLLDLTKDLVSLSDLAVTDIPKEFAELDTVMSKIMNSSDYRIQVKPIPAVDMSMNDTFKETLARHIVTNKVNDTDKLGKVIPNLSSLGTIASNIISTGNKQTVDKMNKLQTLVADVREKGDVIVEMLQKDKVELSKVVLDSFADRMAMVAEACTYAATVYHLNNRTAAVTKAIVEKLKTKLK